MQVEPGKPEQFCTPMDGTENGRLISVAAYPVAWRVETSNDENHRGFEYIRSDKVFLNVPQQLTDASFQFLLGNQEDSYRSVSGPQTRWRSGEVLVVDLSKLRLTWGFTFQVVTHAETPYHNQVWKLVPVKAGSVFAPSQSLPEKHGSVSLPSYDGDTAGQSSVCTQHVESEHDESGTIVNEVTVVTTTSTSTVTTRKKYRVEDA